MSAPLGRRVTYAAGRPGTVAEPALSSRTMGEVGDWELLVAWREGDPRSGQQLVARYLGMLTRFFHNKLRDPDRVPDLVSETMLACTKNKQNVNPTSFRSYLFAVAMNQLRYHYRKSVKRERELNDFEDVFVGDIEDSRSLTSMVDQKQEAQLLVRALRRLSLDQQIILELHFFEGLNGAEIGELLQTPQFTIYTRMRRGKEKLKKLVAQLADDPGLAQSTVMGLQTWAGLVRESLDNPSSR